MFFKKDPLGIVESALDKRSLKYVRLNKSTLMTGFGFEEQTFMVAIVHEEDKQSLMFLFQATKKPVGAFEAMAGGQMPFVRVHTSVGHSAEQVARVCEILLDRNYRIVLGSFERDMSDGEIRFKIGLPYRDTSVTTDQVNWCLDLGVSTMAMVMREVAEALGQRQSREV